MARCVRARRWARGWPRLLLVLCLLAVPIALRAQADEESLSDAEIERLRETAYTPDERVGVFSQLLDSRAKRIEELAAKPRRPGREEDLHDLFQQFTAIVDELNDNLDDYAPRHRDLRKQLPKLRQATDRWATALRSPADNEVYNVSRQLALEGLKDVREEVDKLIPEQKEWFAAHPPGKEEPGAVQAPQS